MKRIYRQTFRELVTIGGMCLAVFVSFLLMGKMLRLSHVLASLDLSLIDVLSLFFYLTPFFLVLLIPVAGMISTFLTFQRMSADRELIALRAGGVSLSQILPAPSLFLLLCAGMTLFMAMFGVSWGMNRFQNTLLDLAQTKAQLSLRPGVFNRDFPGLVVYARNVDRSQGRMQDIFIHDATHAQEGVHIIAPKGRVSTNRRQGKISLHLLNGRMYRFDQGAIDVLSFSSYQVSLDLSRLLQDVDMDRDKPRNMSWTELNAILASPEKRAQKKPQNIRALEVERHKRFALPVACCVLGLVALPLGWILDEVKRQYGALLIIGVFLAYYALFSLGMSLGQTGVLPPAAGIWGPNVLFFFLGLSLFRFAVREGGGLPGIVTPAFWRRVCPLPRSRKAQ